MKHWNWCPCPLKLRALNSACCWGLLEGIHVTEFPLLPEYELHSFLSKSSHLTLTEASPPGCAGPRRIPVLESKKITSSRCLLVAWKHKSLSPCVQSRWELCCPQRKCQYWKVGKVLWLILGIFLPGLTIAFKYPGILAISQPSGCFEVHLLWNTPP